ncbi:11-beta-hydroxysteroid dehydrogenase-like 4A [Rutidosis leptorrhynchoides]|uniref:11-beta-hydroxysteroid dehydrogenase-like 4A n=1 Tax=Rutidosis leptorrhynchoides TaxID=125765 RepID=UPI003A993F56
MRVLNATKTRSKETSCDLWCVYRHNVYPTMYEAYFNNKLTNELVFYLFLLFLFLVSPFLFIWELIHTVRSCFRGSENMSGKVVMITGASSGLGELMAYEYAKRGASLAIIAIKESESRLEKVAERAREVGSPDVLFVFADVSNVEECRTFVNETIQHFGRLDHLVCNAGIGPLYSTNIDVTKFVPVMDINFWGSIYPTHLAIPHLMKTKGKIIVNASSAGILNPPRGGFYNASKAALISFYESLRFEVSPTIAITILTLGFIRTDFITAKYSTTGVGVRLRKDLSSFSPSMEAEPCAKAIVDGVCKGATSITQPRFMKALFLIKFLFPHFHHFYLRLYFPQRNRKFEKVKINL